MAAPNPQQLAAFMQAIREQESGGNYTIQGPSTKYGRATGAYQFLNSTWGGYKGYARAMDAPPAIQDERAAQLMSAYYQRYGSWQLVAVAWHGGPGKADKAHKYGLESLGNLNDGLSRTVDYAKKAEQRTQDLLKQQSDKQNTGGAGNYTGAPLIPGADVAEDAAQIGGFIGGNNAGVVSRDSDDGLSFSGGGPGTVGSYASTAPVVPLGDGTLDLNDPVAVQSEVEARYGEMSDEEFLDRVYSDVLGREADPQGKEFWLGQLASGVSRDQVYRGFYASEEGGETEPPLLTEVELMIRNTYPDWAWAMNNDEVREILLEAVDPTRGLDDATFQSKIRQTTWWQNTQSTVREWDARAAMDPATAQREIEKVAVELQRRAVSLGANLDSAAATSLAEKVMRFGLTEAEINDALADTFDAADPRGDVAANLRQARALAQSYMVNVSDDELIKWAQDVAVGNASPDDLQSRVIKLAQAKFGQNKHLMELLDAGVAPSEYFSDHQRLVAQELDMSPDQVNLMDPKYAKILSTNLDGTIRPMDLDETRAHIRENAAFDWQNTSTGRARIAETTQGLLRAFGKVA